MTLRGIRSGLGPEARASLIAVLLASLLFGAGGFEGLERGLLDAYFTLRGPRAAQAPVAIVAIDEASLARYGQMPWDRHRFAELLGHLKSARVVTFDVAFNEPERAKPGEDAALAQAIRQAPPVILPVFHAFASAEAETPQLFTPLPELARAATALGVAHFSSRHQGTILEVEPYQRQGSEVVPALSMATARAFLQGEGPDLTRGWAFRDEVLTLDYPGPRPSLPVFSAMDVLEGRVPPETFQGKAVLVGATATGLPDTNFPAPSLVGGPIAGVELHAIATENLLSGAGLKRPKAWLVALALLALGLTLGRRFLSPTPTPVRWRLGVLGAGMLGIVLLGFGLFRGLGIWWDVTPALGMVLACFVAGSLWQESALLQSRNRMLEWYASDLRHETKRQREQIDGELHDEAQQLIIVQGRDLKRALRLQDPEAVRAKVDAAVDLNQRILDEILRLRKNLVPHTLSRFGLKAAIAEMASDLSSRGETRVECEVAHWPDGIDPVLESELFWLVKEALNNAMKHAQARTLRIVMDAEPRRLILTIADDGRGFTPSPLSEPPQGHQHTGLHRMWVRAQALHGDLAVQSTPGQGTRLRIAVPYTRPAAERSQAHVEASNPGR